MIISFSDLFSQCPNLLDSIGRKHGYWCEYRKESRWALDTVNRLVAEGNYINGKKQGEWKYYPVFKIRISQAVFIGLFIIQIVAYLLKVP